MAADFGGGLGTVIGGNMASNELENAQAAANGMAGNATGSVGNIADAANRGVSGIAGGANANVGGIASGFMNTTAPYNTFGQSFLPTTTNAIGGVQGAANATQGYNQFMSTYTNTPAAQYQLQQADAVQNNSAAAKGNLLSGANERALGTINSGIVSQNANNAYNEYLSGNNQQFGQLESALGNMFSAIGIGQTATGQMGSLDTSQIGATTGIAGSGIGATSAIAGSGIGANATIANSNINATSNIGQAQAKNDQSKGSGIGSMFGGLGALPFKF